MEEREARGASLFFILNSGRPDIPRHDSLTNAPDCLGNGAAVPVAIDE
jgi:hypothetical protein